MKKLFKEEEIQEKKEPSIFSMRLDLERNNSVIIDILDSLKDKTKRAKENTRDEEKNILNELKKLYNIFDFIRSNVDNLDRLEENTESFRVSFTADDFNHIVFKILAIRDSEIYKKWNDAFPNGYERYLKIKEANDSIIKE